jgi:hypothetical protein
MGDRTFPLGLAIALLMAPLLLDAQEHAAEPVAEEHPHHEVGLMIAHTVVSQGIDINGDRTWMVLPSWGLNYNYWLSRHWAIGLHTDLITETFKVDEDLHEGEEKPTVERTRPIAPAVMVSWKPRKHVSMLLGCGEEFAKEGDLFLMRAGVEYTIHLGGAWETSGSFAYDFRFNAYDSYTFGIGVTHTFR